MFEHHIVLLFNRKKWSLEELAAVQTDLERADKTNNFQTCQKKNSFFTKQDQVEA